MSSTAIHVPMIKRLVLKDVYFLRWPVASYLAAGAVTIFLIALGTEASFYAGVILLFTILIGLGIHLPMITVISERKEQTLPFIMSLPISPMEYSIAKIVANLLIVFVPWAAITAGCVLTLTFRTGLPGGLIPFGVITLTEVLVASSVLLAVALVSESLAWTLTVMVISNLFFQGFLFYVSHLPGISKTMQGPRAVWTPQAFTLLGAEVAIMVVVLGLTFLFQARKTDFI